FNVPIGRHANPTIADAEAIRALSRYLSQNDIQLLNRDFSDLEEVVQPGSFVYIDPPYHPLPNSRSFTTYAKSGFSEEDQQRLKHFSVSLVKKKKCTVLLSNSYTDFILKLYQDPTFEIFEVKANRRINSVSHGRNEISEALIMGAPR
ncbi:MAG: DNA adenine methylase, partial [Okeania sp. SIO1H5]|uniref:DNA adenine methylase n=1 Tax=Okeania sp. SIO1H5 TaxID=2607777 RepID=UPI0013BD3E8A